MSAERNWTNCSFFVSEQKPLKDIPGDIKMSCTVGQMSILLASANPSSLFLLDGREPVIRPIEEFGNVHVLYLQAAYNSDQALLVTKGGNLKYTIRILAVKGDKLNKIYEKTLPVSDGEELVCFTASLDLSHVAYVRRTQTKPDKICFHDTRTNENGLGFLASLTTISIDGISCLFLGQQKEGRGKVCYIAARNGIHFYDGKGVKQISSLRYEGGCERGLVSPENTLHLCIDGTIHVWNGCQELAKYQLAKADCKMVAWFKQYFVELYEGKETDQGGMVIYDLQHHLIVSELTGGMMLSITPGISNLFLIVRAQGRVELKILREEPIKLEQRVEKLMDQGKMDIALKLVEAYSLNPENPALVSEIHRRAGDRYYERCEYENAVKEYTKTIGVLEPSHVIQLFVNRRYARYLIEYLEALQEFGEGSNSSKGLQTTLLFNCYVSLNQVEKISFQCDNAIMQHKAGLEPKFDVDAAIEVLSRYDNGNQYQLQCKQMAKTFGLHEVYIKSLLRSGDTGEDWMEYLGGLQAEVAKKELMKYGALLIDKMKVLTSEGGGADTRNLSRLLLDICRKERKELSNDVCACDQFRAMFSLKHDVYFHFLELHAQEEGSVLPESLWNDYILCACEIDPRKLKAIITNPQAKYSTEQATILLKERAMALDRRLKDGVDPNEIGAEREYLREACKCLYRKRGLYIEHLSLCNPDELLNACEEYGKNKVEVWKEALGLAIAKKADNAASDILKKIFSEKVIPLTVLLRIFPRASEFGLIKEFTFNMLNKLATEITEQEAERDRVDGLLSKKGSLGDPVKLEGNGRITVPCTYFGCGHVKSETDLSGYCTRCETTSESLTTEFEQGISEDIFSNDPDPFVAFNHALACLTDNDMLLN